jgi:phosphoglycolate phosphatase
MFLIVFDLDGTLIDSRRDLAESTNEMLQSYGAAPRPVEDVAGMVGEGAKKLVERALAAAGLDPRTPDALDRFRAIYDRRLLDHTVPYDGIADVVPAAARRATLAVLTNKPEAPSRRLLDAFGLSRHFAQVLGGDSAFARKPDPGGLTHLMTAAGTTPASTLLIGDSMIDVETARRAGISLAVALYGFGALRGDLVLSPEEQSWTAAAPRDLLRLIERFLAASGVSGRV